MSTPGWYPDPGGRPGHYRLWDGQGWGLSTTSDPPGGPSSAPPPPPRRRRAGRWVLAAVAVVVVAAVVAALVVWGGNRPIVDGGRAPTPPATGGDSSAPVPPSAVPSSADPTPSASPSPTPSPSDAPSASCPLGDPTARQEHPDDGRVHGGGLSFPMQRGWSFPGEQASDFTWAYDVGETDLRVEPSWFSSYAVGALSVADGFEDPRSAATLVLRCTLASSFYRNVVGEPTLVERQTTLDGYPAFTISTQVHVDDDRTTFAGDTLVITVVDLGSPEALGFFWGCAPLGDPDRTAQLQQTYDRLQVD